MSGYIYCFNTHENPNIIKAGHTQQQDVQKRLRGYLGPTKPRSIIFTLKVDDSVEAERMMLQLMQQCVSLNKRCDLGNEWFETTGNFNFEQRASHLQTIAKIVQKASSIPSIPSIPPSIIPPSIPPSVQENNRDIRLLQNVLRGGHLIVENVPVEGTWIVGVREREDAFEGERQHKRTFSETNSSELDPEPPVQQATGLRGLEDYFKKLDDFVAQEAKPNTSPLELLRSYESSTFCRYGNMCQFLPFSESERVKVVSNRYRDFLS